MTNAPESSVPDRRYFRTPATAPGPMGGEMLRSIGRIRTNPMGFLLDMRQRHGDIVQFPIPEPPTYLVSSPGAVRRVLVGNAGNYGKDTLQYRSLALLTGMGLLSADTEPWRRQRRLVQPAFHPRTLENVGGITARAADALLTRLTSPAQGHQGHGPTVVDVDAAMMETALEVVGEALFGTDLSDTAARLTHATLEGLDVVVAKARMPLPIPSRVPTPANRKLAAARATLDAAVADMIDSHVAGNGSEDMLSLLLTSTDGDGNRLTRQEIRDEMVTFIVAGHETVASALSWTWQLLATHSQVRAALHAELDALGRDATYEDLPALTYTRAVFDEALRLYPPAWLITRQALQSDTLDGYEIPAGALIVISPYVVHRHPSVVEDPEAFAPQRFLQGDKSLRQTMIPFGSGPRQCIGRDFAYVEAILILANLARRVTFDTIAGKPARALPVVTIRPAGGLPMSVRVRH